jgi:20S proteasome alpha/beta subunit
MTTIAYREGILAGDTRVAYGQDVLDDMVKVHVLPDGSLFGGAGDVEDIKRLQKAMENGDDEPVLKNISAIMIKPNGQVWNYERSVWVRLRGQYFAIGSGAIAALSAMDAGADAIKAIKIAIRRNTGTGGRVTHVSLKPKTKRKSNDKSIPKSKAA